MFACAYGTKGLSGQIAQVRAKVSLKKGDESKMWSLLWLATDKPR